MKQLLFILLMLTMLLSSLVSTSAPCTQANLITRVFKFQITTHEFVIFKIRRTFTGSFNISTLNSLPSFPMDEGGQNISTVQGCRFVKVQFTNMNWMCSITPSNAPSTNRIKDIKRVGNFEGVVTFLVGYKCPASKYQGYQTYTIGNYDYVELKFRK